MELNEYVAALRKRWLVIVALMLVGGLLSYGYALSTTPLYRATAKVYVSLINGASTNDLVQGATYVRNVVESYAMVSTMPIVLEPVVEELGLDTSAKSLAGSVSAESPINTQIIELSVSRGDPDEAATIANAVAEQLSSTVETLSPTADEAPQAVAVTVVEPATAPSWAAEPNTKMLVATGLAGGAVAGVVLAMALALLDTRVRSSKDLEALHESAAVLGSIPRTKRRVDAQLPTVTQPLSPQAEAYRRLQTNLSYINVSSPLRSIVVTSSVPREGKTTTVANLATALAETGRRILLIDADLRRPRLAQMLGLEGAAGLTTVLIGQASFADVVQPWGATGVDVLTSGGIPPNPHQLVDSAAMRDVVQEAISSYDMVILDAPPLLPVSDAAVLARITDGALLVVACRRARRTWVESAVEALETVGARCIGMVSNFVSRADAGSAYAYSSGKPRRWSRYRPGTMEPTQAESMPRRGAASDRSLPVDARPVHPVELQSTADRRAG